MYMAQPLEAALECIRSVSDQGMNGSCLSVRPSHAEGGDTTDAFEDIAPHACLAVKISCHTTLSKCSIFFKWHLILLKVCQQQVAPQLVSEHESA